jgi:hypothetical protein
MQKNEEGLLAAWLGYHLRLAAPADIFVFDNGSSLEATLRILAEAEGRGVRVERRFNAGADYARRDEIFRERINGLIAGGLYDVVLPMDCDEFLAVQAENAEGVAFEPGAIFDELEKFAGLDGFFEASGSWFNDPGQDEIFFFSPDESVFFNSSSPLDYLHHGFHRTALVSGAPAVRTGIVLLHFHFKRLELAKVHAAEKLKSRVRDFSRDFMATYDGPGSHMARLFLVQKHEYQGWLMSNAPRRRLAGFNGALAQAGVAFPHALFFPTDRYEAARPALAENPFLAAAVAEGLLTEELLFICRHAADAGRLLMFAESALVPLLLHATLGEAMICRLPPDRIGQILMQPEFSKFGTAGRVRVASAGGLDLIVESRNAYRKDPAQDSVIAVLVGPRRMDNALSVLALNDGNIVVVFCAFWSDPSCHQILRYFDIIDTEGDAVLLRPSARERMIET